MKYRYLLIAIFAFCSFEVQAGFIQEANQQLRAIFSGLQNPDPTVRVLYDMACHRVDSAFYSVYCMDTTCTDTWFFMYEELYNAAYDTTTFTRAEDLANGALARFADTIQMGIIDLRYLYFMPTALTTGHFFDFDIDNNILFDDRVNTIGEEEAYGKGEVFMAAPLIWYTNSFNPIFEISPSQVILDAVTGTENLEYLNFRIDFGDGQGWHYLNLQTSNYVSANYVSNGMHTIISEFVDGNDNVYKHSVSRIYVDGNESPIPNADSTFQSDGLRVFEYRPHCTYSNNDKFIFILAGYNPMSFYNYGIRTSDQLYKKYVKDGNHEDLLNYGYTIVIVDWEDHNDLIQKNAYRFARLLDHYKCIQRGDEEFVVIGQSMGCLIGRYALTWMESDDYVPSTDCKREKRHNTRLFISNDGPHQGVNIPLSLQCLYGEAFSDNSVISDLADFLNVISFGKINFTNTLLKGNSVKQMLYYHYSTGTDGYFYADPLHNEFLLDIKSIGNYPKYCKLVAQSNGSLEGLKQQQLFSSIPRQAYRLRSENDRLIDISFSVGIRILGMKFAEGMSASLNTNPNPNGDLYTFSIDKIHPSIRLYWFGISVSTVIDRDVYRNEAKNTLPYCIMPGGNEYLSLRNSQRDVHYFIPFLGGLGLEQNNGCIEVDGYIGIPWLCALEGTFRFCTDGLGFGFVPIVSAFDYEVFSYGDYYTDFIHADKQSVFARTPFDVLIGQYSNDTTLQYNMNHENIINVPVRQGLSITRDSLLHRKSPVRVVNRIIGDEELWLNNMTKPWEAYYSAEQRIHVNAPEDFLFHETYSSVVNERVGAFTRDNLFVPDRNYINIFSSTRAIDIHSYPADWKEEIGEYIDCWEDEEKKVGERIFPIDANEERVAPVIGYELYSVNGNLIYKSTISDSEQSLAGIYVPSIYDVVIVKFYTDSGDTYCKLFIK